MLPFTQPTAYGLGKSGWVTAPKKLVALLPPKPDPAKRGRAAAKPKRARRESS